MAELYQVIYTGQLRLGIDKQEAMQSFCERFKVPEEKARKVLSATRDLILKKRLEEDKANKYRKALEAVGLIVRVEPMQSEPAPGGLSLKPIESQAEQPGGDETQVLSTVNSRPACPKCGSHQIEADTCQACGIVISKFQARQAEETPDAANNAGVGVGGAGTNPEADPYAAPDANLVQEVEPGELTGPNNRPAGHGWWWIRRGFWHFRQNPLAWIVTLVIWVALSMAANFIPIVGGLAITLVSPVITAGFMLGCAAQEQNQDFEISHLFAGFSNGAGQLVLVGLLYMVGIIVVVAVVGVVGGGVMVGLMGGMEAMQNPTPDMMANGADFGSFILILLLVFALFIPVMMAYWFAPALVALEGMSALAAMKMSFSGCLKNILPFLVYGLIGVILMAIASIPLGLGLLVMLPVLIASIYSSYRDIFYS